VAAASRCCCGGRDGDAAGASSAARTPAAAAVAGRCEGLPVCAVVLGGNADEHGSRRWVLHGRLLLAETLLVICSKWRSAVAERAALQC
jgi:hypothetical protein